MNDSSGVAGMPISACDSLVEPDLLDDGGVLHQAQQCGPGRHQRPACLLFGQPVQAAIELTAVLVEEHLELGPGRLVDGVLGGRRWGKDMSEAFQDRRPQAS
jgi:hypothetical protein